MIYDDVVRETLIEPLPAQRSDELEPPPPVHDAMDCDVCRAWLAHVRAAEDRS